MKYWNVRYKVEKDLSRSGNILQFGTYIFSILLFHVLFKPSALEFFNWGFKSLVIKLFMLRTTQSAETSEIFPFVAVTLGLSYYKIKKYNLINCIFSQRTNCFPIIP
jgi:hypothetical protein